MTTGRHVVKNQAAVAVHCINQLLHRAQAGDHDGHFVLDADLQVRFQSRITVVNDQVYGIGRRVLQ
ncbi:hypothetical protein D3C76_1639000 [compost metagenome]